MHNCSTRVLVSSALLFVWFFFLSLQAFFVWLLGAVFGEKAAFRAL